MPNIFEALAIAAQRLQAGQLEAAEQIYREILAVEPNNGIAWHRLGLIEFRKANLGTAIEYLGRALTLMPEFAEGYTDLGAVVQQQGDLERAIANHRRALQLAPHLAQAYFNLGNALQAQTSLDERPNAIVGPWNCNRITGRHSTTGASYSANSRILLRQCLFGSGAGTKA